MTPRIAIDAAALHGPRTGIGVFTEQLLARLGPRSDMDVEAFAVTYRGRGQLGSLVPAGVKPVGRPMAARPLAECWKRTNWPPIDWFIGPADLVHGPNYVVPPTRGAARLVSVHDLTPWHFPELSNVDTRRYPTLVRRAVAAGAWVHTGTEFVAAELRDALDVDPARVVVVPYGATAIPPEGPGTDSARGCQLAGGDRYVLSVGTVEPRKDTPGLAKAFDRVAGDDPDVRLVIAGPDGWGAEALTTTIAAARHRARIVRLGWVSDDDRAALLRGATLLAYPSVYEGFGLPPLEAMLAGTPVLATNTGAVTEVVGEAAELVPVRDVDALATAMARLLRDDARRAELVAAGTARVARYPWDRTADAMAALYRRILDDR